MREAPGKPLHDDTIVRPLPGPGSLAPSRPPQACCQRDELRRGTRVLSRALPGKRDHAPMLATRERIPCKWHESLPRGGTTSSPEKGSLMYPFRTRKPRRRCEIGQEKLPDPTKDPVIERKADARPPIRTSGLPGRGLFVHQGLRRSPRRRLAFGPEQEARISHSERDSRVQDHLARREDARPPHLAPTAVVSRSTEDLPACGPRRAPGWSGQQSGRVRPAAGSSPAS
jgi:hypothetical protein